MKITKTGWWMIGGATMAAVTVGVFVTLSRKRKKEKQQAQQVIGKDIGSGIQVSTGNQGTIKREPSWDKPFDMNYLTNVQQWIAPRKIKILDDATARNLAKKLKNAKGTFNDDEDAVKDVFAKRLRDKTQVASLSKAYWQLYKQDLWKHLSSFLSASEMKQYVHNPVRQFPNYQTQ